jgi:probable phosphoglycerate mutase
MAVTYVLRHGRTELSAEYIASGDPALPVQLDPTGVAQCQRLATARWLPTIATCVVSEFPRTRQTAELLLGSAQPVLVNEPRLNEINYGIYEGQPWMAYGAWLRSAGPGAIPPGGESRDATVGRMLAGLVGSLDLPGPRLVVGHGLMISVLLQLLRGRSLDRWDLPDALYVKPIPLTDQRLRQLIAAYHKGERNHRNFADVPH